VEVPHSYIAACAVFCIELPRCATLDTWMQYLRNATLLAVLLCVRLLVLWRRYEFHVYAVMVQRVRILMFALNWA